MRLLRRKPKKSDACGKLELERVIGLTTTTAAGLACNGEELAYLAGCVVVVYNVRTNCQTHFLVAPRGPKAFACVAYSGQGGKFVAAGESGHQPAVVVWEVATGTCINDMKSHKYGVSCVQFSPNGKHLVSLGIPHDGYMCLWDWKSGALLMKTRAAVTSLSATTLQFATDGSFFVSGGTKHLKHWTIGGPRARSSGMNTNPGMDGKPVKLGSQKDSLFVSVASTAAVSKEHASGVPSHQPLYALTSAGILCLLHRGLAIEKWVDLQVKQAYALATSEGHVACACSEGIVRIFVQGSLEYTATLPRPAPYGYHGLTDANVGAYLAVGHRVTSGIKFPDAIACSFLQQGEKLAVIYDDHSLYVWDVRSYSKIGRYRTFLSHSSCIWDVVNIPEVRQSTDEKMSLPREAFATCSADGTIRLWHLDLGQEETSQELTIPSSATNEWGRNVYSKEILGVLYIDTLGEQRDSVSSSGVHEDAMDTTVGFRSISVSMDGNHLAAGDSSGNLRIYDLNSLLLHSFQEAHDAEILSLSFTTVVNSENDLVDPDSSSVPLLASGGRDRLIHVYDVNRGYDVIETLDDHTASITTVKFACNGSKLLSCSADKSVVFRNVAVTTAGCKSSRYHQEIATRGTIYDMDTDVSDKLAVTVGQDKKLNILSLATGKPVRCFKPEGDVGEPIKVRMDPSGLYMVCSHSDRCMRIFDFMTGEPSAQASGHAEVITGVTFLPDCRRLISVSGDSCIFVWRLPLMLSRAMRKQCSAIAESRPPLKTLKSAVPRSRLNDLSRAAKIPRVHQPKQEQVMTGKLNHITSLESDENHCGIERDQNTDQQNAGILQDRETTTPPKEAGGGAEVEEETPAAFRFSVSRLPPWAQAKLALEEANGSGAEGGPTAKGNGHLSFESRWTERLGHEGYKLFSEFMEEATPPATIRASGFGARRRFSVEGGCTAESDCTPESTSSLHQSSPLSSPREPPRTETQWTTVHTVFLDDSDFDDTPKIHPPGHGGLSKPLVKSQRVASKSLLRMETKGKGKNEAEDTDHVSVGLSDDDEGEPIGKRVSEEPLSAPAGEASKEGAEAIFKASSKNNNEVMEGSQSGLSSPLNTTKRGGVDDEDTKRLSSLDSEKLSVESEEEVAEDDEFSPRDLFSAHFDKLASDLKVGGSARSSYSARFFAQSNTKGSQSTLFQSSPAGGRIKLRTDTQALLEDNAVPQLTPAQLLAAERERLKSQEQERSTAEVQHMQERLVNLGLSSSEISNTTENPQGFKSMEAAEVISNALDCTGSPQPPDLVPSKSPPLAQDRKGVNPLKFQNGTPKSSPYSAMKKVPASPSLYSRFQDRCTERKSSGLNEHLNFGEVQVPHANGNQADVSIVTVKTSEALTKCHPTTNPELQTSLKVLPHASSKENGRFPGMDDALKQSSASVGASTGDHNLEFQDDKEEVEVDIFTSATGLSADGSDIDGPLHSSWDPVPPRTAKTLPRPLEDYQKALKELADAAIKANMLFSEVYSLYEKRAPMEAMVNPDNLPLNLPSDVLLTGQAFQKVVPETLQLVQKLSDKVTACTFRPECIEAAKCSGDASLCDFSFQKSNDYGDNSLQMWPRTSGASLDSLLSSVDVESFISRYSETLASQVLALVQKSLPPPPS